MQHLRQVHAAHQHTRACHGFRMAFLHPTAIQITCRAWMRALCQAILRINRGMPAMPCTSHSMSIPVHESEKSLIRRQHASHNLST